MAGESDTAGAILSLSLENVPGGAYLGSVGELIRRDSVPLAPQGADVLLVHDLPNAVAVVLAALAGLAVAVGPYRAGMRKVLHMRRGRVQRRRCGRCSWTTGPARGLGLGARQDGQCRASGREGEGRGGAVVLPPKARALSDHRR